MATSLLFSNSLFGGGARSAAARFGASRERRREAKDDSKQSLFKNKCRLCADNN